MAAGAKDPPFSRVWATVCRAAGEAELSGGEFCVLVALMRWQGENGELSRPAAEVAEECGLSVSTVRHALVSLTRKRFRTTDDGDAPLLSRVRAGHRGNPAVYRLNVPREPWWGRQG